MAGKGGPLRGGKHAHIPSGMSTRICEVGSGEKPDLSAPMLEETAKAGVSGCRGVSWLEQFENTGTGHLRVVAVRPAPHCDANGSSGSAHSTGSKKKRQPRRA